MRKTKIRNDLLPNRSNFFQNFPNNIIKFIHPLFCNALSSDHIAGGIILDIYTLKTMYEKNEKNDIIFGAYKELIKNTDEKRLKELGFIAAKNADPRALELLFNEGLDPNTVDDYSRTLLHQAAKKEWGFYRPERNDMIDVVNLLLDKNVNVFRKEDNEKMVCYHYAAKAGNYEFVETLAKRGTKLNMADKKGNTGIHLAADAVKHAISSLKHSENDLERAKKRSNDFINERLANGWDMDRIKKYMEGQRVPTADEEERKHRALEEKVEDYFKTVKAFNDGGVDIDEKNEYGETALKFAINGNAKKIAAYLNGTLDNNDDAVTAGGMTLHQAAQKNDADAIRALAALGADMNEFLNDEKYNHGGCTALGIACSFLRSDAALVLLKCGADPSIKDNNGNVAVSYILSPDVLASLNLSTFEEKRIERILDALIDSGFDLNMFVNENSDTLLNLACSSSRGTSYNGHSTKRTVIDYVLKNSVDVNIANRFGESPLMHACEKDFEIMENVQIRLLEIGANVNAKDEKSDTALHYAARNTSKAGAKTLADMLVEFGADITEGNNEGKTALDIATEQNNEPLVKLLLDHS